ncbi:hypothetical protein ABT095_18300 [Kitasatospora sp. NPDC002227]|uniref:hypothetical protein n=1 Tax=Kitasatospora sp. NPDC002227 TaxID=3154773 RepID=UPI00331B1C81
MGETSRKPRWARRRVATVLTASAVLAGAAAWAVTEITDSDVQFQTVSSRADVVGTWQGQDGPTRIRLDSDGQFTATALPNDVFNSADKRAGSTSTMGTWMLKPSREGVELSPAGSPPSSYPGQGSGLGIVQTDHGTELCVLSGSQGVLCDELLRRVSG